MSHIKIIQGLYVTRALAVPTVTYTCNCISSSALMHNKINPTLEFSRHPASANAHQITCGLGFNHVKRWHQSAVTRVKISFLVIKNTSKVEQTNDEANHENQNNECM